MLDKLKDIKQSLLDEVSKYKNRDFLEGLVASCAIVAASDGAIKEEEKTKMINYIKLSEELKVFDISEVIKAFTKYTDMIQFDLGIGKEEALKAIRKMKHKGDEARMMVRVCCMIGSADGDFDDKEKESVRSICRELNLTPSDFDL